MNRKEFILTLQILALTSVSTQVPEYAVSRNVTDSVEYPTLRVATQVRKPWVVWTGDGYEGFLVDLLDSVSEMSNFSYTLVNSSSTLNGRMMYLHGEVLVSGVLGDIVSGKADLGLADLIISDERARFVSFSLPFATTGAHILVRKAAPKHRGITLLVMPFSLELWIVTLVSITVAVLVSCLGQTAARKCGNSPNDCTESLCLRGLCRCLASLFSFRGKIQRRCLMSLCTWICLVVLVVMYVSNMSNYLTTTSFSKPVLPFKTFGELVDQSNVEYGGWFGMPLDRNDEVHSRIWRHIESKHTHYSSLEEAVKRVLDEENPYVAIIDGYNGQYLASHHCDLLLLQEQLLDINYGMACPKTSSGEVLCESISEAITSLKEDGTVYRLATKWFWSESKCPNVSEEDYTTAMPAYFRSLAVSDLCLVFIVLWIGIIVDGIGVLYGRICKKKYDKTKEQQTNNGTAGPSHDKNRGKTVELTQLDETTEVTESKISG